MDDEDLRDSFEHFDKDGDGRIDLEEFGELCRALGGDIEDAHRDVGFSAIDKDHNGYIDFEEFSDWWRNQL